MTLSGQNRRRIKKVIKGLTKASKTHAGQAKTLKNAIRRKNDKKNKRS